MIEIIYKCRCMKAEETVQVREREEGEEIVDWVRDIVGAAIDEAHRARSPFCMATHMEYAKIPAPENAPFIGGKPRLDS